MILRGTGMGRFHHPDQVGASAEQENREEAGVDGSSPFWNG
jgi:hypothetical protein